MSTTNDELNPIDGYLLELLGDYHRHLCVSCDGAENGCINCRQTGYDQTPCKICDKDGMAFKNRREFLDKVKAHTEQRVCDARIKENRNIKHQAMSADDNLQLILCIDQRIANLKELKAQLKKSTKGGSDAS